MSFFDLKKENSPFESYQEYTNHLFACVDKQLSAYINKLMQLFAKESGGFKNVIYPDIEVARDLCEKHLVDFRSKLGYQVGPAVQDAEEEEDFSPIPDELAALFAELGDDMPDEPVEEIESSVEELLVYIDKRTALTEIPLPLYNLCQKLGFSHFQSLY